MRFEFWEALYDYMVEEFSIDDMLDRDMFLVHAHDMEKAVAAALLPDDGWRHDVAMLGGDPTL